MLMMVLPRLVGASSPSSRRAWIEIRPAGTWPAGCPVALLAEGVDFGSAGEKKYAFGIVACHDGTVYKYSTRNAQPFAVSVIDKKVDIYSKPPYNMGIIEAFQCALRGAQNAYGIEWSELK